MSRKKAKTDQKLLAQFAQDYPELAPFAHMDANGADTPQLVKDLATIARCTRLVSNVSKRSAQYTLDNGDEDVRETRMFLDSAQEALTGCLERMVRSDLLFDPGKESAQSAQSGAVFAEGAQVTLKANRTAGLVSLLTQCAGMSAQEAQEYAQNPLTILERIDSRTLRIDVPELPFPYQCDRGAFHAPGSEPGGVSAEQTAQDAQSA